MPVLATLQLLANARARQQFKRLTLRGIELNKLLLAKNYVNKMISAREFG
jgi:hypothetical protein